MPIHDWTRVRAGMFHDFHHEWLASIKHALNGGILPKGFYAAVDQYAGGYLPDVLTLESVGGPGNGPPAERTNGPTLLAKPRRRATSEVEIDDYRRRTKLVAVRHVSDDEVIAIVEIVSPGNKKGEAAFSAFVKKVARLLAQQIHVLIVDLFPPGRRDPHGLHGAIWEEIADENYRVPKRKPLTVASYEAGELVRSYVEHCAIGDKLPDMPLFLEPGGCVEVLLEKTYTSAFAEVPRTWRDKLNA